MLSVRNKLLFFILFVLPLSGVISQVTNISGIINTVNVAVTNVNAVTNEVTVTSTAGLSIGDTVLVIQMKGAITNTTNTASFGDITAMNNAGKYEKNIICAINGNDITLTHTLANAYDPASAVQLIRIPTYQNANVNGTLTANPWNGSTGGVLVFEVRGTLSLGVGTAISMNGTGFRGGVHEIIADVCGCSFGGDPQYTDYFYPGPNNALAALKGEGIAASVSGAESGKGKLASAGGGGNDHNAGGGGGANFGAGGQGGTPCATRSCFFGQYCRGQHPGVGGAALSGQYSTVENRIFPGGGGGAGDDNGGAGSGGGDGGGIVIIIADSVVGNNRNIFARGDNAVTGAGDGTGGGGAGGTVLLDVRAFHSSNLNIFAEGGRGGNSSWGATTSTHNSKGKGGGGGGGLVWHQGATLPGNVVTNLAGGASGMEVAASCPGHTGGALAGGNGSVLSNLAIPFLVGSLHPPCGVFPITYTDFEARSTDRGSVLLQWAVASDAPLHRFSVDRSSDGVSFTSIATIRPQGQDKTLFQWEDVQPDQGINWYRITYSDANGQVETSELRKVEFAYSDLEIKPLRPVPVRSGYPLTFGWVAREPGAGTLEVFHASGKRVFQHQLHWEAGESQYQISLPGVPAGIYLLKFTPSGQKPVLRKFLLTP